MGARTPPREATHHFIQRRVQTARFELLANTHALTAIPPVAGLLIKDVVLLPGVGGSLRERFLGGRALSYTFFWRACSSSASTGSSLSCPVVELAPCNPSMRSCSSSMVISSC